MTYNRLKSALEQIAAGVADPIDVAKEALRSRVVAAKPKPPKPARTPAMEIHDRMVERWNTAAEMRIDGKTIAEIAIVLGVSKQRARQICRSAKRSMRHPSRKDECLVRIGQAWLNDGKYS